MIRTDIGFKNFIFRSEYFALEMSVCLFLLFLLRLIVIQAFDVNVFLSLNCYKKEDVFLTEASIKEHVFCERFTLNANEVNDFQTLDFVVSNEESIVFKNCDIGVFNHNFLMKFPKALSIQLNNVTLDMSSSPPMNHPLRELSIYGGNISSVQGYKAWRHLPELRTFILGRTSGQSVNGNMTIDFFAGNKKLQTIKLFKEQIAYIDPSALKTLQDLKSIHLTDLELESLPSDLFCCNDLESINLSGNKFERIPRFSHIYKNLRHIILINCDIKNVTRVDLRYREQLQYLVLDGNKIQKFEKGVFENLPNLRYLSMVANQLKDITLDYFGRMLSLENLNVEWNYLNTSNFLPESWNQEFYVEYLNQLGNEVKKEMGSDGNFSIVGGM